MHIRAVINARTPGETLATVAIGAAAGVIAVLALEQADRYLSKLAGEEARAQRAAARPDGGPRGEKSAHTEERAAGITQPRETHPVTGEIVQYAVAILPVIAYAFFRDKLPVRGAVRGLAFGETMFVAQDELLNTFIGRNGKLSAYPWTAHAQGAAAHAFYGVVAELAISLFEGAGKRLRAGHRTRVTERNGERTGATMDKPWRETGAMAPPTAHRTDRASSMGARSSKDAVHAS